MSPPAHKKEHAPHPQGVEHVDSRLEGVSLRIRFVLRPYTMMIDAQDFGFDERGFNT